MDVDFIKSLNEEDLSEEIIDEEEEGDLQSPHVALSTNNQPKKPASAY